VKAAKGNEHYLLSCRECGFTHHIPRDCQVQSVAFSVHLPDARMQCVYGGAFTVTLSVGEFFSIEPVPASNKVLKASIVDNMKVLHRHIVSHCDPTFLVIKQSHNRSSHDYKRQPEGSNYVKYSKDGGMDLVGKIDVSKAEIPGVSW
jgi:hypothetical protein